MNNKVELTMEQKKKFAGLFEERGSFSKYLLCTYVPEVVIAYAIIDIIYRGIDEAKAGDYTRIIIMSVIICIALAVFAKLYRTARIFGLGDSTAFVRHKLMATVVPKEDIRIVSKELSVNEKGSVSEEEGYNIYYTLDGKEYMADNTLLHTKKLIKDSGDRLVIVTHKEMKWEVAYSLFEIICD